MILRQLLHSEPTIAVSYLFGCGGNQAGEVVDPVDPPAFYLRAAQCAMASDSSLATSWPR